MSGAHSGDGSTAAIQPGYRYNTGVPSVHYSSPKVMHRYWQSGGYVLASPHLLQREEYTPSSKLRGRPPVQLIHASR